MEITLPAELEEMVKEKVRTGEYASAADVVSEGLRLLEAEEDLQRFEALKRDIAAGIEEADRGELVSAEEVFSRLRERNRRISTKR
jgi:antitoxin ParD1/3/4